MVRIPPCLIQLESAFPSTYEKDKNRKAWGWGKNTHSSSSEVNSRPPAVRINQRPANHGSDGEAHERRDDGHRHDLTAELQRHNVGHGAGADAVGGRRRTARDEAEDDERHQVRGPRRRQGRDGEDDVGGVVDAQAAKDLGERAEDALGRSLVSILSPLASFILLALSQWCFRLPSELTVERPPTPAGRWRLP